MHEMPEIKRFAVITGHYGCGKTNLSLNLALDSVGRYAEVTVVDLDVVNPYFRSSDYTAMLAERGVQVVSPTFAGTTLDAPSLSAAIYSTFESDGAVIFDVGGDDVGATALGRFAKDIAQIDYDLLYVVNRYRNLTARPREAATLLSGIEAASHLRATGVVNNSHLRDETVLATVLDSVAYAREVASMLRLPLAFTTVPAHIAHELAASPDAATLIENPYTVEVYVRTPWENAPGAVRHEEDGEVI